MPWMIVTIRAVLSRYTNALKHKYIKLLKFYYSHHFTTPIHHTPPDLR